MKRMLSTKVVVAAVAVLAVAITGGAIAATKATSPRAESQAVVNDAARQLGVQPSELSAALRKAFANRVDAAVREGRMTKAEGARLKARINSGPLPLFGPGIHKARGMHGPGFHFPALEAAAEYLGLSREELHEQLNSGKTLAELARDRDKSLDGLIDALVAAKNERLEQAVRDGRLTRAEADRIREGLRERVSEFVNEAQLRFHERRGPDRSGGELLPAPELAPPGAELPLF